MAIQVTEIIILVLDIVVDLFQEVLRHFLELSRVCIMQIMGRLREPMHTCVRDFLRDVEWVLEIDNRVL